MTGGTAICSIIESVDFEVYENYQSRAIQEYLSNIREEMPHRTWEVRACNSRESRVGERFGGLYRK